MYETPCLFWPSQDWEGPQPRREPSIEDIFILLKCEILPICKYFRSLGCFFHRPTYNPVLSIVSLHSRVSAQAFNWSSRYARRYLLPQFERNRLGIGDPTIIAVRYTSPVCFQASDTSLLHSAWDQSKVRLPSYAAMIVERKSSVI